MGIRGIRPNKQINDSKLIPEPPLIVNVNDIVDNADRSGHINDGRVDINAIVLSNGIKIEYELLSTSESGYLRCVDGQWVIGINEKHNIKRQRFTLAHELAHYYLHKDCLNTNFEDTTFFRNDNLTAIEFAANDFAASLLMPETIVKQYIAKGVVLLEELSEKFGVSIDAMRYRIESLGYKTQRNG